MAMQKQEQEKVQANASDSEDRSGRIRMQPRLSMLGFRPTGDTLASLRRVWDLHLPSPPGR